MAIDIIHDRGRGPEIVGTRITVYNLLPYFLEPDTTEALICRIYGLSPEQVAAARAYVLNHFEGVTAMHQRIEARNPASANRCGYLDSLLAYTNPQALRKYHSPVSKNTMAKNSGHWSHKVFFVSCLTSR